jgi:hypothetical protein
VQNIVGQPRLQKNSVEGKIMKFRIATCLAIAATVVVATPALAKAKKKTPKSQSYSGIYCEQGAQNIFIPAASLPAKYRKTIRKGQKARINVAGIGPLSCRAY